MLALILRFDSTSEIEKEYNRCVTKRIAVLGSTGSIGRQTLDVVRDLKGEVKVVALTANDRCDVILEQAREFGVRHIGLGETCCNNLTHLPVDAKIYAGIDGLCEIATLPEVDMVVFALFGAVGLKPLVAAIDAKKDIAFATKEALVAGGKLVIDLVRERGVNFLPIDSEHNSVWRCLTGRTSRMIRKVILTASGGPFHGFTREQLATVTPERALIHPIWEMGKRITVNSATMMNKALEIIEAHYLFDLPSEKLDVLVHPQGVVHAMIELGDGTVIAHIGRADMKLPIGYCLTYPFKPVTAEPAVDLTALAGLTFEKPDEEVFTPLKLGRRALASDWTFSVALNALNETLVDAFLDSRIPFISILENLDKAADGFDRYAGRPHNIDEVIALDAEVRESAKVNNISAK